MNPLDRQRVSPNRVALILGLLLVVWLVFQFCPRSAKPVPPVTPPAAETKLHAVGLADYTDWEGLPDFFAVWAEHAEWKDGRTRFAYWHPVMKTYSYFFEATRKDGKIRFREIAEPHDPDHFWDESLGEECPIRFYHSVPAPALARPPTGIISDPVKRDIPVKVNIDGTAPGIPPSETKIIPGSPAAKH